MSNCVLKITLYRIPKTPLESILGDKEPLFLQRLLNAFLHSPCLTFRIPAISSSKGYPAALNILHPCSDPPTSWGQSHLQCGVNLFRLTGSQSRATKTIRVKRPLLHMQPLEGCRVVLCPDLPLSVISALNLDFNLGPTCCYICIQLIFQGCGGGVMLLWQPNNSGPEDRRNGISGSRPPKDSETPISALFHRNESWDATINRPLFSFLQVSSHWQK